MIDEKNVETAEQEKQEQTESHEQGQIEGQQELFENIPKIIKYEEVNGERIPVIKANDKVNIVDFGFEPSPKAYSVAEFTQKHMLERFKFNDALQRQYVWPMQKRYDLIHSILVDIYIPPVIVEIIRGNKAKIRNVLDGIQRLLSIVGFKKDEWALGKVRYINGMDENGTKYLIDISGMKFSELPSSFQERINSFIIEIREYENLDEETKKLFFERVNSGMPLKPQEKRRTIMTMDFIKFIANVRDQLIFTSGIRKATLKNDAHGELLIQSMLTLKHNGDTGIGKAAIDNFIIQGYSEDEELRDKLISISEYLSKVAKDTEEKYHDVFFSKTRVPSLFVAGEIAIENDVKLSDFADWLYKFFIDDYNSTGFEEFDSESTTTKKNVKGRTDILVKHMCKHFNISG